MLNTEDFTGWAIVELVGRRQYAGHVSTQAIGGSAMLRLDIPQVSDRPAHTKLFNVTAICSLTPVSRQAAMLATQTASRFELYEQLLCESRQLLNAESNVGWESLQRIVAALDGYSVTENCLTP